MAITLDTIVNKVFKVVKNGYDNNEVESFLDEILEEMENREAETNIRRSQNCPAPFLPPMRINARLAASSGSHRRFITRSTDNSLPCAE